MKVHDIIYRCDNINVDSPVTIIDGNNPIHYSCWQDMESKRLYDKVDDFFVDSEGNVIIHVNRFPDVRKCH